MAKRPQYLGWIVVEEPAPGMNPQVYVEFDNGHERERIFQGYANSGCTKAIEWWDGRVGGAVSLTPTIKGCYRVSRLEDEC